MKMCELKKKSQQKRMREDSEEEEDDDDDDDDDHCASMVDEMAKAHSKETLKAMVSDMGLSPSGNRQALANKYMKHLYFADDESSSEDEDDDDSSSGGDSSD